MVPEANDNKSVSINLPFFYPKGIFPCSYIHLKNAVVKNKGWVASLWFAVSIRESDDSFSRKRLRLQAIWDRDARRRLCHHGDDVNPERVGRHVEAALRGRDDYMHLDTIPVWVDTGLGDWKTVKAVSTPFHLLNWLCLWPIKLSRGLIELNWWILWDRRGKKATKSSRHWSLLAKIHF